MPIYIFGESADDYATDNNNNTSMSLELVDQESAPPSNSNPQDMSPLLPLSGNPDDDSSPSPPTPEPPANTKTQALQLLFGAGGIYASFLYYGSLQEDVFRYEAEDGTKFTAAWYLQVLESGANVMFGTIALIIMGLTGTGQGSSKYWGGTPNLPKVPFISTGFSQVCSKGFTSLALANGLSFPVATLAKSGKMAPVMIGSLLLGGAKYG